MLLKLIINLSNYMKHIGFKELIFICTQELSEPNCVISIYGIYFSFEAHEYMFFHIKIISTAILF